MNRLFWLLLSFFFLLLFSFDQALADKFYKVKPGDKLDVIAKKYGVTVEELKKWNNLKGNKLSPGTLLRIVEVPTYHVVKKGESLEGIAKRYGMAVEELKRINNLKTNKLQTGQRLLIKPPEVQEFKRKDSEVIEEADSVAKLFHHLQAKEKKKLLAQPNRKTYLELINEYRRIYLLYPSAEEAPLALLKAAELQHELYQRSLKREDLTKAINFYEQFLKHYSGHAEEIKVLEKLAQVYEVDLKDKAKAKRIREVLAKKPKTPSKVLPIAKEQESHRQKTENKTEPRKEAPRETTLISDVKKLLKVEPVTGEDYTRIILDLSGSFEYQANILPEMKDRPPRIYVDLFPVTLTENVEREISIEHKHLTRIRVGQFDRQTVRIVLDMTSLTSHKIFKVREPYQLIIDLIGRERKDKKVAVEPNLERKKEKRREVAKGKTEVLEQRKEEAKKGGEDQSYIPLAKQLGLGVRRVVIDPGHGGDDPGALGPNGLKEKEINLKIALRLGEILRERMGVEVVYTRSSDVFVPLTKRPAIANSVKGDIFVSIHLNASPDQKAKGVEVYYLNFTTDPEAMRVAALENRVANKGLADLQDLVKALISNTKLKESQVLAERVQVELVRTLNQRYPDVIDRGVKYAPFLVLVGTRMPAILVEAEFITNPQVADRLKDDSFIDTIALGIAKGIETYTQSLKLSSATFKPEENKLETRKP